MREVAIQRLQKKNLAHSNDIVQDVLNLEEAVSNRHGILVVGKPMAGKSTAIKILTETLQQLFTEEIAARRNNFLLQKGERLGIPTTMEDD